MVFLNRRRFAAKFSKRSYVWRNSLILIGFLVSLVCFLVFLLAYSEPADISVWHGTTSNTAKIRKGLIDDVYELGIYGRMMLDMLGYDLPFTVFVPSEKSFEELLKPQINGTMNKEMENEIDAIVSRVLGFSAVPQHFLSAAASVQQEIVLYSISGFQLDVVKISNGVIVVNSIESEKIDLRRKDVIVHIMDGVLMDAEFDQSVRPINDEDEDAV